MYCAYFSDHSLQHHLNNAKRELSVKHLIGDKLAFTFAFAFSKLASILRAIKYIIVLAPKASIFNGHGEYGD